MLLKYCTSVTGRPALLSILFYFILLLHCSLEANIVLFTRLHLFDMSYFAESDY